MDRVSGFVREDRNRPHLLVGCDLTPCFSESLFAGFDRTWFFCRARLGPGAGGVVVADIQDFFRKLQVS